MRRHTYVMAERPYRCAVLAMQAPRDAVRGFGRASADTLTLWRRNEHPDP